MRLFNEKVTPTLTNSSLNILKVENFEEVFFGVYEIELNKNKYLVEKISDHDGDPLVSVPVDVKGKRRFIPFILVEGKFDVIFNESCEYIEEVEENTPDKEDELVQIMETVEDTDSPILESKRDKLLEEIRNAKTYNEQELKRIKRKQQRSLREESEKKEQALEQYLEESRENLVEEFLSISNSIKEELFESNDTTRVEAENHISRKIHSLSQELRESLEDEIQQSSKNFRSSAKKFLTELKEKDIKPNIDSKLKAINDDFDSKFGKLGAEVKKQIQESINRYEKSEKILSEKRGKEDKKFLIEGLSKAKTTLLKEFMEISNDLKGEIVDKKDDQYKELKTEITEKVDTVTNNLQKLVENDLKEGKKKLNSSIKKLLVELYDENITKRVDTELKEIAEDIVSKVDGINEEVSTRVDKIDKDLNKKIKNKINKEDITSLEKHIEYRFNCLTESNIEMNDKFNHNINKALSRVGNVGTELKEITEGINTKIGDLKDKVKENLKEKVDKKEIEERIRVLVENDKTLGNNLKKNINTLDEKIHSMGEEVGQAIDDKLTEIEENVRSYYDDRLEMLEERRFDIKEDARQEITGIIEDSKKKLISELRDFKNEKPIEFVIENDNGKNTKSFHQITEEVEDKIRKKVDDEVTRMRKFVSYNSGGGSVAQQFANGGTMNGSLTVHGLLNSTAVASKIKRHTSTTTIDDTAYQWNGNTDGGGFTYTLPVGIQDVNYKIVNTGTSGNALTIVPNGSEKLIGADSFVLIDGESLVIGYDTIDGWY